MARTRDIAPFLLVVVLFGGAFPAIKVGVAFVPPLLLAAARYPLGGPVDRIRRRDSGLLATAAR